MMYYLLLSCYATNSPHYTRFHITWHFAVLFCAIFFAETNEIWKVISGEKKEYFYIYMHEISHPQRLANLWVRERTYRPLNFYFLQTNKNNWALIWSVVILKWKPFGRFNRLSVTMPWASYKIRSYQNHFTDWWRGFHQAEMIRMTRPGQGG